MKFKYFLLFFICFSSFLTGYQRRLYVGYEFDYEDLKHPPLSYAKLHEYGMENGFMLGYERISCNWFYFKLEGQRKLAKQNEKNTSTAQSSKSRESSNNYELLLGFSGYLPRLFYFIPYIGVGYNNLDKHFEEDIGLEYKKLHYRYLYFPYGATLYIPMKIIDLAFNLKISTLIVSKIDVYLTDTFYHSEIFRGTQKPTFNFKNSCQYEVSASLFYKLKRNLDIAFIPYYKDKNLKKGNKIKYFDNQVIYGPESDGYEVGMKIQLGLRF